MSGAQSSRKETSTSDASTKETAQDGVETKDTQAERAKLEEDDEFEDFPAEDWTEENTDLPSGNTHLWEESWDDDDTNDDFSAQLKEELKKLEDSKKS